MSVKPAYHIALTASEKRLVAEIGAIQSQIEWLMRITVQDLLKISPETARLIMGSTRIETNADSWISVIREKVTKPNVLEWAEFAFEQMPRIARDRNSFMHTLYGFATDLVPSGTAFTYAHRTKKHDMLRPRKAVKVKDLREVSLVNLKSIRDDMARMSIIFAHVHHDVGPYTSNSPWLRRLGAQHPPRFQKAPHK